MNRLIYIGFDEIFDCVIKILFMCVNLYMYRYYVT